MSLPTALFLLGATATAVSLTPDLLTHLARRWRARKDHP